MPTNCKWNSFETAISTSRLQFHLKPSNRYIDANLLNHAEFFTDIKVFNFQWGSKFVDAKHEIDVLCDQ